MRRGSAGDLYKLWMAGSCYKIAVRPTSAQAFEVGAFAIAALLPFKQEQPSCHAQLPTTPYRLPP